MPIIYIELQLQQQQKKEIFIDEDSFIKRYQKKTIYNNNNGKMETQKHFK